MTFLSDHGNDTVSSQSLVEETTTGTLAPPSLHTMPLPTLPCDLVAEILCRLPVKLLLQLRCICKSWKSLISDPAFAKMHLRISKTCHHNHHLLVKTMNTSLNPLLWDSPVPSVFDAASTSGVVAQTQLSCPDTLNTNVLDTDLRVCSCDGVLCFTINGHFPLLWNPSIRRFNMFPPLENRGKRVPRSLYSFGYDHLSHSYKIIVVSFFYDKNNEVSVYTLGGTDSWRRIREFPYSGSIRRPGVFVSGTINWLVYDGSSNFSYTIVSLDLWKESYQKLLLPDVETDRWMLAVLRDCLCIFASTDVFVDVWIMKEYGNEESWTKLYRVPYMRDWGLSPNDNALYITEDDQVLMYFQDVMQSKLGVYDSNYGTFNMPEFQNISSWMDPKVYVRV